MGYGVACDCVGEVGEFLVDSFHLIFPFSSAPHSRGNYVVFYSEVVFRPCDLFFQVLIVGFLFAFRSYVVLIMAVMLAGG